MSTQTGKVYLVGAGPGDVGLITVRGVQCLQLSDVVVYDKLANESLLDHVPRAAERIFVGKESSQHTLSQGEINEVLVEKARAGHTVTRLKGGDPFLFGRGGEEAQHLFENQVPFEIIPGVTSAIAVPAYAGIPVTHRSVNGSLHIVTGHENVEGVGPEVDWEVLARSKGTIVFLMGVGNLPGIVKQLQAGGLDSATPVALVRWGTLPEQQTLVSTLSQVAGEVRRRGFGSPAVGVIGEVVNLRSQIQWVEQRPLFGIRVALTRPAEQADALAQQLRALGAEVALTPTIQIIPRLCRTEDREMIKALASRRYKWLILTSPIGVSTFARFLFEAGFDSRALRGVNIAAIGERTAEALAQIGIRADLVPLSFAQEGLAQAIPVVGGDAVLIARAATARDVLETDLEQLGAAVSILKLYDTVADRDGISALRKQLTRGRVQLVTFTSGTTFQHFAASLKQEDLPKLFQDVTIASIGPVTTKEISASGLSVAIEAPRATAVSLAQSIEAYYREQRAAATQTR